MDWAKYLSYLLFFSHSLPKIVCQKPPTYCQNIDYLPIWKDNLLLNTERRIQNYKHANLNGEDQNWIGTSQTKLDLGLARHLLHVNYTNWSKLDFGRLSENFWRANGTHWIEMELLQRRIGEVSIWNLASSLVEFVSIGLLWEDLLETFLGISGRILFVHFMLQKFKSKNFVNILLALYLCRFCITIRF